MRLRADSAQVGATAARKDIRSYLQSAICGAVTSSSHARGRQHQRLVGKLGRRVGATDVPAGRRYAPQEGIQNIITYSIGVVSPADQCKPDYPALLTTMAKYGGGKYFNTGDASEIKNALDHNSQRGTSRQQRVLLGQPAGQRECGGHLPEPDLPGHVPSRCSGSPRWLGNLKQYQAIKTSSGDLAMGDATGKPAISSAGTGFISPNAISFWTKKDTTQAPDDAATGGFWKNDMKGSAERLRLARRRSRRKGRRCAAAAAPKPYSDVRRGRRHGRQPASHVHLLPERRTCTPA